MTGACSYQNFGRFFSEFLYWNERMQLVQIGEKESEDKSVGKTERKPESRMSSRQTGVSIIVRKIPIIFLREGGAGI